ncbi:hypothetical protein CTI14_03565 [Methylobacterium radiotolerans]|nr:hypothetical protein CTI14_03565 [Methylobacterium radiotolerans]
MCLRITHADAERWKAGFEQVSAFRTAFYFGHVEMAEARLGRRKNADFGDALNTTSRWRGWRRNPVRPSRSQAISLSA